MHAVKTPDPTYDFMMLDNMYAFPMYLLFNKIQKFYAPGLDRLGLSYAQFLAMASLWEQDGQIVTQIGRTLRYETGTLTPLLKKLEASGYIRRERQENDKRQVRIYVTDKGWLLREQSAQIFQCLSVYGSKVGFTKDELDDFRKTVRRFLERFDQLSDHVSSNMCWVLAGVGPLIC